jgi:Nucleotidyltransferase/DNA polymerase involved in DNA repair
MQDQTLPGTVTTSETERVILHVDMDCFYASCERLRAPELEGEPLVIGMGYAPGADGGAVATASYEAREHGVHSAQPIDQALALLPLESQEPDVVTGVYRSVDMEYYRAVAAEVKAVLRAYADIIREVSIDEAYLDVSDQAAWGGEHSEPQELAADLKHEIADTVGVPASVGVAANMATAKIASDHDKPDGLVIVPPGAAEAFLAPLPIDDLHGIGPVSAGELRDRGVETIGDLAATEAATVTRLFGSRGIELQQRARGIDPRAVEPTGSPKSLSRERSMQATDDAVAIAEAIEQLAEAVAERAQQKGALYRTIGIKIVTPPYDINTRERSLGGPVDDPELVRTVALDLLGEFDGRTVRKVGVRVSNLSFAPTDQSDLQGWTSPMDRPTRRRRRGQTSLDGFDGH